MPVSISMAQTKGSTMDVFFKSLLDKRSAIESNSSLINTIRQHAEQKLAHLTAPTTKDEEWRFTNLKSLYRIDLDSATEAEYSNIFEYTNIAESQGAQITFVNGQIDQSLTDLSAVNSFIRIVQFSSASDSDSNAISKHLNAHMSLEDDAFLHLNAALLSDGVWIDIPKDIVLETPIHIRFINNSKTANASAPRVLVTAASHSKAVIIEESMGTEDSVYLNVPVLEFDLHRGAHITHVKFQNDSKKAFHIGRVGATVARDGHYESYSIQIGAAISRNDVVATQLEEQMFATLDGLVLIGTDQLSDTHTLMDHRKAYGESHQLHKVLVDGQATSVFNGKIFVRQDAQKVNSYQENRNLLMSSEGTVHTKPQLEIFADDVKCSHGATIGQLVPEELFYLKSRGLDDRSSRELLTQAFALEIIENIPVETLRSRLATIVSDFAHQSVTEALTV
jgi:Fe-S cluster assembly protein SufD